MPAMAADSLTIYEEYGNTTTNYPVQIGRFFAKGELASYPQVLINGTPVITQADLKDRWSDGSVRYSLLSFYIPTLSANSSVTITFQNQTTCNCALDGSGSGLTASQMQASGYNFDAQVQLTQPFCTGTCNTKTASARQMLTDGNFTYWAAGPNATTVILASDGPCGTAGKCAYDMGWERDANSGNDYTFLTASITSSQTTMHVNDATGWTTPLDCTVLQTNGSFNPFPQGANPEHMTVTGISYDSGDAGPATLTVTRHSNVPQGGHAYTVASGTSAVAVYPNRWKEPTSTFCGSGDPNCMNVFRPRVIATFFPTTNQVKIRFVGEISDTQRFGDLTYSLLLTIGNTNPVTVWQQSNIYHIAGTRWTKTTYDWCEAENNCGSGNTSTTITPNPNHIWTVSPSGIIRPIGYPRELWLGGNPTPVAIDHNAAYLSSSKATYEYAYSNSTITEAILDQSFSDTGGTGSGWNNHLSTGNYGANPNAGWTDANIQGVTSTAFRTINALAPGAQMGDISINMGGGGGSSEDCNGPQPLWVVQYLYSMSQGVDHGLRMFLKMQGNADLSTGFPFHWREGKAGSVMDYNDTAGSGTGVGHPISIYNRPTSSYSIMSLGVASADRITPVSVTEAQYVAYTTTDVANGWWPGPNHMPHYYPLLYAVTGDYFYLEQMEFWSSFFILYVPPVTSGNNAYAGRGPTGAEALIAQTINGDPGEYGSAVRSEAGEFTLRSEHAGFEVGCATLSSGNCVPSTPAKYYRNAEANALCGMEGAKNYTAGCKATGTTLQVNSWNWANTSQWLSDELGQSSGSSLGLPLNLWQDMDGPPANPDCGYGVNVGGGRAFCPDHAVSSVAGAHSSGAGIKIVTNILTGALRSTVGFTTQAISGNVTISTCTATTPITCTFASMPSWWANGTSIYVAQIESSGFVPGKNYGMLGIWTLASVNSSAGTAVLTGSAPWPAGASSFAAGPYAIDRQFTVDSASATAINAAVNDSGGVGPPGVRILIDSEYMYVCSVVSQVVTLCPLDNTHGMRNTLLHFGDHYMMHALERAGDFEFSASWLGQYFGGFWVNGLTDGTHTPRLDFNPYLFSLGRWPTVEPDGHTLITTWAEANAGFDYEAQALAVWMAPNLNCGGWEGYCYAYELLGAVSWASDFNTANATLAWNWLASPTGGNLLPQMSVNDPFEAKWLFAPRNVNGSCSITTTTLPNGNVGAAYSQTIATNGCTSPTFSVSSGALPGNLSISSATGSISGVPTSSGTSNFTVAVSDANGNPTGTFSITINRITVSGSVKLTGNSTIH